MKKEQTQRKNHKEELWFMIIYCQRSNSFWHFVGPFSTCKTRAVRKKCFRDWWFESIVRIHGPMRNSKSYLKKPFWIYTLVKINTSPLRTLCTRMPQGTPFVTLPVCLYVRSLKSPPPCWTTLILLINNVIMNTIYNKHSGDDQCFLDVCWWHGVRSMKIFSTPFTNFPHTLFALPSLIGRIGVILCWVGECWEG